MTLNSVREPSRLYLTLWLICARLTRSDLWDYLIFSRANRSRNKNPFPIYLPRLTRSDCLPRGFGPFKCGRVTLYASTMALIKIAAKKIGLPRRLCVGKKRTTDTQAI